MCPAPRAPLSTRTDRRVPVLAPALAPVLAPVLAPALAPVLVQVLVFGLIDILTRYNGKKRVEHFVRGRLTGANVFLLGSSNGERRKTGTHRLHAHTHTRAQCHIHTVPF